LRLYEYIDIYGETKTQLIANNTYNSIETYLPLQEIYYITQEVLKLPDIESITDEQDLDKRPIDELIQKSVNQVMQQLEQPEPQQQQQFNPLGLQHGTIVPEGEAVTVGTGGKNNPKSKHNTKYRKKYKKFVSKYIIKKNKKQNKNKNKSTTSISTKNKTKKNKKIAKNNSKYAMKTLKNKNKKRKSKSKSSNHKSKHNKKVNTNYYNLYKHNKTLKH
jgi:hypothetical protein